jgi:hypothetical protein
VELNDLLKVKLSGDVIELSAQEQKLILQETFCEYSGKPGKEVELYIRFRTKKEINQLLAQEDIARIYYRRKRDYIESLKSDKKELAELSTKIKDAEEWKIIATVESYNNQECSNCKNSNKSYVGTYQILQHKKYYDRRRLLKLDEQIAAIFECKVFVTDEIISTCYNCRKMVDTSDLKKEYGTLFKRML